MQPSLERLFKTSPFILQHLFRKPRFVLSQLSYTTEGLEQFPAACPCRTQVLQEQPPHLHFMLGFSTPARMAPPKVHVSCAVVQRPFSSRTFPMAQLSLPALSSPCCCSSGDTQCTDLSCFRAVQEIQRSPFLPLCSSNELCDATQPLIFSRVVAG